MVASVRVKRHLLRIAIRSPLPQLFDYLPPPGLAFEDFPSEGTRVLVPFGRRKLMGIVVACTDEPSAYQDKLKPIISVLEEMPSLSSHALRLAIWCSDYYHHPLGDILHTMLPAQLRQVKPVEVRQQGWQITTEGMDALTSDMRAQKQKACLLWLADTKTAIAASKAQEKGFSPAILRALLDKAYVAKVPLLIETEDVPLQQVGQAKENPPQLNEAQLQAVEIITASKGYETFLLDGVTGSGKTEVYLHCIQRWLKEGGQVLVLVPEIGLTPQTIVRFRARLKVPIGVWHSHMTDAERYLTWQQAKQGEIRVLIGTRSAIFVGMPNLVAIIIDEAHDASFKQQAGLRYMANDLARVRAKDLAIPVVLGTATPPLACLVPSRFPIKHVRLPERAGKALKPLWSLIDLRSLPIKSGLSRPLLAKIAQHLEAGNQVLVFLNQRGYSPVLICHQCGEVAACQRCDAKMTLHENPKRLLCHHCGAHRRDHARCQSCNSTDLLAAGVGTGRLEEALRSHFPQVPLLRIDRDSVRKKGSLNNMLSSIHSNEYQILVGTQMLAKGHDFPHLTLVAVVNMDDGFFSADYHAVERMGALMVQVAGRAGRAEKRGEVVVQTHQPEHPLLQLLINQGYHAFVDALLEERQVIHLPPYGHMALLRASSPQARTPEVLLQKILAQTPSFEGTKLVGPMASSLAKKAGHYRFQLLVWSDTRQQRHRCLAHVKALLYQLPEAKRVRWSIDVDPIDMQ